MNTTFYMHCGAKALDRNALVELPEPPPKTDTWQPIRHAELVSQVESALVNQGMRVVEQSHAIAAGGNRYFGMLQVARAETLEVRVQADTALVKRAEYAYVVGLRNSHDKSFPAGLVVGANCFICDNLSFNGEIRIARKHTSRILDDLPILTTNAVGMLSQKWTSMDERIEAYRRHEMTDSTVHDFVIRALDGGACVLKQIPAVLDQWRKPNHPEFAQDHSAWRLFNAFTEVAKEGSLWVLPKRTTNLHALLDAEVGLLTTGEEITAGTEDATVEVQ